MKRYVMLVVRFVLEIVQLAVVAMVTVLFTWPRRGLSWCERQLVTHAYYYGIVRLKRRVIGQPAWQSQDLQLGVPPPPDYQPPESETSSWAVKIERAHQRYQACSLAYNDPQLVEYAQHMSSPDIGAHPLLHAMAVSWLSERDNFFEAKDYFASTANLPAQPSNVTCAFCGTVMAPDASTMREHSLTCEKCPLVIELKSLRAQLGAVKGDRL